MMSIAGSSVKTPSKFRVSYEDVRTMDNNAAGLAVIDRLARKRRISAEWRYLSNSDMNTIATKAGKTSPLFSVTYYDPDDGASKTITCFLVNFEMGMQRYASSAAVGWEDVKLEVREQ
jgi:hypothetical protein